MIAQRQKNATRRFGSPADWPDEPGSPPCETLDIIDVPTDEGPFMVSKWKPSADEIAILAAGGTIDLFIRGDVHPVVALGVSP